MLLRSLALSLLLPSLALTHPHELDPDSSLSADTASASSPRYHNKILLLRHGEKGRNGETGLNATGKKRAKCLKKVLGRKGPHHVGLILAEGYNPVTKKRRRPYETVKPLADELGLKVDTECEVDDAKCVRKKVERYAKEGGKGDVVICWKHSMLHVIAQELGAPKTSPYPDDRYDIMWTLHHHRIIAKERERCPGIDPPPSKHDPDVELDWHPTLDDEDDLDEVEDELEMVDLFRSGRESGQYRLGEVESRILYSLMAARAPVLALVGATGLVGSALLSHFLAALSSGKLSTLRILTSSPSSPKLEDARGTNGVEVVQVRYADEASLERGLQGADVLVSAMGAAETKEGKYEDNKQKLLDAALKAGVKVYVPSEWGTDHNTAAGKAIGSPMFLNKQHHHEEAEERGLQVIAVYNALILEISFSDWLGIPISSPNPTWTIPRPSHPVAFTSLRDLGPCVLSAILQTLSSSTSPTNASSPIPSRLRIYSDSLDLDAAADLWEQLAGGKVTRQYVDEEGLRAKYDKIKPTLKQGMLGPAIPLMIAMGGFDYEEDNANAQLNVADFAFEPRTVEAFLKDKARELK
ncbi:hypothetical protein JCM1841_002328 [Sporobolomyces salmonicolor]